MKGSQIIERLEQEIPLHFAESWDNSGLQVGYRDREVRKVYVALDATEEALEESILWGADLLLTHHPLLMSGIKKGDRRGVSWKKDPADGRKSPNPLRTSHQF